MGFNLKMSFLNILKIDKVVPFVAEWLHNTGGMIGVRPFENRFFQIQPFKTRLFFIQAIQIWSFEFDFLGGYREVVVPQ